MTGHTDVTVRLARDAGQVHAYLVDARHLPVWAPAFARAVREVDGRWLVSTPDGGEVEVRFTAPDEPGCADHRVVGPDLDLLVPLRVLPAPGGCEVRLSVQRLPGTSDTAHGRDVALVESDLRRLADVLG